MQALAISVRAGLWVMGVDAASGSCALAGAAKLMNASSATVARIRSFMAGVVVSFLSLILIFESHTDNFVERLCNFSVKVLNI